MASVVLVGQFHPSQYQSQTIAEELVQWLMELGLLTDPDHRCEVRSPSYNKRLQGDGNVTSWHHDAGLSRRIGLKLVFWSSEAPTEVREVGGERIPWILPHDVVLVDNDACEHRAPGGDYHDRWFARVTVSSRVTRQSSFGPWEVGTD